VGKWGWDAKGGQASTPTPPEPWWTSEGEEFLKEKIRVLVLKTQQKRASFNNPAQDQDLDPFPKSFSISRRHSELFQNDF